MTDLILIGANLSVTETDLILNIPNINQVVRILLGQWYEFNLKNRKICKVRFSVTHNQSVLSRFPVSCVGCMH